jgi:hypothetical protein
MFTVAYYISQVNNDKPINAVNHIQLLITPFTRPVYFGKAFQTAGVYNKVKKIEILRYGIKFTVYIKFLFI